MVYVLDKDNKPLMPTKRHGKVRRLLKTKKAKVVNLKPFTIQLLFETGNTVQKTTLGIDSGYQHIGFSVVTKAQELLSGELELLSGISERLNQKRMYRRNRRSRLLYRKPNFLKDTKGKDWLAPSIQHKYDSHLKLVERIKKILPVTDVILEVANFDIQKIKNPKIEGKEYQEGEQKGFSDLREYILHRDRHT